MRPFKRSMMIALVALAAWVSPAARASAAGGGELTLSVIDQDTRQPVACRLHLRNGKERPQRVPKAPFWHDHVALAGSAKLKLPRGVYHFEIERGPEYLLRNGYFIIESQAKDEKVIDLKRSVNMADEGWWSGDLDIHRPTREIELLMRAEDLHVGGLITWNNKQSQWVGREPATEPALRFDNDRYYTLMAGEDVGLGGTLAYFNLRQPAATAGQAANEAASLEALSAARGESSAWIDAPAPTALDLPLWLGTGRVDSIGIANDQMRRTDMKEDAGGRPRDQRLLAGPLGIGLWSQELYYHVLNCGLRIPPSAGSGSGEATNPVGYNRVYVWLGQEEFSYDAWWEAFRQGRVMVTNGPLVRPFANGQPPGHVFREQGEEFIAQINFNLSFREPIRYFELVQDGRVVTTVSFDELSKTGRLPPLTFSRSGWFLLRAVSELEETFRFASSAPWYVEIGGERRVSRRSAQFFLDGLVERRQQLQQAQQLAGHVAEACDEAERFWRERLENATAD
jgi:hypothetical protein